MSQIDSTEQPLLNFLRATPEAIMDRPPLCSSLQSLESSFILISLSRFPHGFGDMCVVDRELYEVGFGEVS